MGEHAQQKGTSTPEAESGLTDQTDSNADIDKRKGSGAQHDGDSEQEGCTADNAGTPLRAEKSPLHACHAGEGNQAIQGAGEKKGATAHRTQSARTNHATSNTSASDFGSHTKARANESATANTADEARDHVVTDSISVGLSAAAGNDNGTHIVAESSVQGA